MESARYLHDPQPWGDLWTEEGDLWPTHEDPENPDSEEGLEGRQPELNLGPRQLSFENLPEDLRGMYYVG